MKKEIYDRLFARPTRRRFLQGTAGIGAVSALGALGGLPRRALAQSDLRTQILQIPGVGMGSPTDADWQEVGALCLEATKANVAQGEFGGVALTFMGLNNQNLHNFLFRGFLKPWEEYTGATISWIDLAQADYNARLQQSIATGTVDFDILEMGAPFEVDVCGKGARLRDARLGRRTDRDGRLRRLSPGARGNLGRQDLPHLDRRRLPQLQLPHRLLRGRGAREGLAGRGP
jgi:multiple sugar transport system substrate-binding protein